MAMTIVVVVVLISAVPRTDAAARQQTPVLASASQESLSGPLEEAKRLQQEADAHLAARQLEDAGKKAERALAIRRQYFGEVHADVAYSMSQLGNIAYRQGQYDR